MTAFDYGRAADTANRLIERYGQLGAVRRKVSTGPKHNPTRTPTDHPARFAVVDYDSQQIDGARILRTDKRVLLAKGGLAINPTETDELVEASGETYKIIAVDTLKPATTVVVYDIQARR